MPTPTLRPPLGYGSLWRLISHLSLRHVSFEDPGRSADALRETMRLYDFSGSAANRSMIEGVLDIKTRRVLVDVGRGVSRGRCQGVETTVHFDENRFVGSGVYLLASVLDRFLGLYCSLNSFSQLVATTNKRDVPLHRWPPRSGDAVLVDGEFQTLE